METVKMKPTSMKVSFPKVVTMRNTVVQHIKALLFPAGYSDNVLYLGGDKAVELAPDGSFTVKAVGVETIHVIPTESTKLYQTIKVQVVAPALRKVSSSSLRLRNNGLRFY